MATFWTALQGLRQDFRRLRRSPAFTLTAVLTRWPSGVTANVVVFGVLNGLLFKPLPIHKRGRFTSCSTGREATPRFPFHSIAICAKRAELSRRLEPIACSR